MRQGGCRQDAPGDCESSAPRSAGTTGRWALQCISAEVQRQLEEAKLVKEQARVEESAREKMLRDADATRGIPHAAAIRK